MKPFHRIKAINFIADKMNMIVDNNEYSFDLNNISSKLKKASIEERNNFEISPSGYGIHWPSIDEDLSIDGLIGKKHSPSKRKKRRFLVP